MEEKLVELEVLTELTKDDILGSSTLSQLLLGDRLMLRRAMAGLCTEVTQEAPPAEPRTIPNRPVTTADMAADGDICEKLRQFEMESDHLADLFDGMLLCDRFCLFCQRHSRRWRNRIAQW